MGEQGYYIKVIVDFYTREDGGLRATSKDVPGLILSSADPDKLLADIAPAIEHIMKINHNIDVEMKPLTPARNYLEKQGVIRPDPKQAHSTVEFAGRPKAA